MAFQGFKRFKFLFLSLCVEVAVRFLGRRVLSLGSWRFLGLGFLGHEVLRLEGARHIQSRELPGWEQQGTFWIRFVFEGGLGGFRIFRVWGLGFVITPIYIPYIRSPYIPR